MKAKACLKDFKKLQLLYVLVGVILASCDQELLFVFHQALLYLLYHILLGFIFEFGGVLWGGQVLPDGILIAFAKSRIHREWLSPILHGLQVNYVGAKVNALLSTVAVLLNLVCYFCPVDEFQIC